MPWWGTLVLTLGVAVVTAGAAPLAQRQAAQHERRKFLLEKSHHQFRTFMLSVASAVDATIFAVRSFQPAAPSGEDITRARDAVEKIRQMRIQLPLMLSYLGDREPVEVAEDLLDLLSRSAYSLRVHIGDTRAAPAQHFDSIEDLVAAVRPKPDRLQNELGEALISSIRKSPGSSGA